METTPAHKAELSEQDDDWRPLNPLPASRLRLLGEQLEPLFPSDSSDDLPPRLQKLVQALGGKPAST